MDGVKNCLIGLSCISVDDRAREIELSRRMMKARNKQIDKEIRIQLERRQKEHKILFLGCGKAGKSTFIKQMRIIHSNQFSQKERTEYRKTIATNIATTLYTLLDNADWTCGLKSNAKDKSSKDDQLAYEAKDKLYPLLHINSNGSSVCEMKPSEIYNVIDEIEILWNSNPVQAAYKNRNTFILDDSAGYFLSRARKIMNDEYLPTNEDILHSRVKTFGVVTHEFELHQKNGPQSGKVIMIDVGGQRNERRKWIHVFDDILLLMFVAAVSEFDQVLEEDNMTNSLEESLQLFETITASDFFKSTPIVLFLNKIDVLKEKVAEGIKFSRYFPEYCGRDDEFDSIIDYVSDQFAERKAKNEHDYDDRPLYIHQTCATDTENIKVVFSMVHDIILNNIFSEIGMGY